MELFERLLALTLSCLMLGLGWVLRRRSGTWATPAALFCGFWFLFSFIPLLVLFYVPVNPLAIGYLFLCCLAFSLPALMTDWGPIQERNATYAEARRDYLAGRTIQIVFIGSFCISILFILLDLFVQGISLSQMVFNFFSSANTYLEKRYESDIKSNLFGQWGLITAYLCVTFGGLLHAQASSSRQRGRILVMLMTPPVLVMLVQSAKGLFFISIAILLGAHLVHRILSDQRPHVDFMALARQAKYLVPVIPLTVLSFLTRGLYALGDTAEVMQRLISYLYSYAFLHIYAFSDWFTFRIGQASLQEYPSEPLTYGFYTFIAVFKLLGSDKFVPGGVYEEYFVFGDMSPGNIYTLYRGLITDFGLAGTLLMMIIFGAIFNAAYIRMLSVRYPTISIAVAFLFVQLLYTSYIISALIWNTTYLVTVLNALILILNRHYVRERFRGDSHSGANSSYFPQ